ncbi:mariner-1 protein [Trichonephila clavata]|uniref:Mariner-1 protein n=1 Tax=Trichonephila clavata TaxID=2740835 RepID=A0A8X6GC90_TRICU|nr:mariner-1 protein [Trichonephila clavata]
MYDNRKRSFQWLDKDEPPKHCLKRDRDIHPKELMVTVWRSGSGHIHHSFTEPGQSIMAYVYCYQPEEMMRNLRLNSQNWLIGLQCSNDDFNSPARQHSTTGRTKDRVKATG